ncbi:MAG TPA: hypothetical protein VIJ72_05625 [Rhizomicrobium sp.]
MLKKHLLLGFAVLALAAPASAQMHRYPVQTMNFDLWCQEQANLPPDRCDKRLPQDEKVFEAYRSKIERYEIPYLQEKENEAQFNRTVLHNDPIDNPIDKNTASQDQQPSEDARTPPPP